MAKFTIKQYEQIADVMANNQEWHDILSELIDLFKSNNPNFSRDKFIKRVSKGVADDKIKIY